MKIKIITLLLFILMLTSNVLNIFANSVDINLPPLEQGITRVVHSYSKGSMFACYKPSVEGQTINTVIYAVLQPIESGGAYYISPDILIYSDKPFNYSYYCTDSQMGSHDCLGISEISDWSNGYYYAFGGSYSTCAITGGSVSSLNAQYIYTTSSSVPSDWFTAHSREFSYMQEFVKNYLQNGAEGIENMDGVSNGNSNPSTYYDLEPPLDFRIKQKSLVDLKIIELGKDSTFYMYWEQSEGVNVQGWETEIYYKDKGYTRKNWYSVNKKKYELPWTYYTSVPNYKNKYTFNYEKVPIPQSLIDKLGYKPYEQVTTKLDFMIRNKCIDSDGNIHYSNYVYIDNLNGSGSDGSDMDYVATEIDGSSLDNEGMSNDNIDKNIVSDSDYYINTDVSGNSSYNDVASAFSILKSISNDLKEFPSFFSSFFSFIPSQYVYALSAMIILLIAVAFIKAII